MKSITSRDNPTYKQLGHLLREAHARKEQHRTVLEGIHLCQTAVQQGVPLRQLWCSETALQNAEVNAFCAQVQCEIFFIPDRLFSAVSTLEHGIGLLAVIAIPTASLPEKLSENCLLLDRVQDPGNLGTLMRTAAAAGHRKIFCGPGCADPWSPKVLRAGMGAHFYLEILQAEDWSQLLPRIVVPILATDLHGAQSLYALDLRAPAAWLFGNEGSGVAPELLAAATTRVRISQPGKIESLNVAAAAAICLFEQVRQQEI
ncbi:MAG: RNA methyltransferase [Burkholderiaceae bacterium]|nr:MAG: RNA methyltransferase [Burkholderiaceae bacterium]